MSNPFTPSFGVSPPLLVGRDVELEDFQAALDGGLGDPARAVLLTGVRGAGKTVLLNAFEDQARRRGWLVLSESARPGIVAEMTATSLPTALAAAADTATEASTTSVNVTAAGFGGGITRERRTLHPVTPSLRSQLTELADLADSRGVGVLLSIDEIHRAATDDLRVITQTVQHLFREGRPLAFAAAGLPLAVTDILNDSVTTFLRRAERFTLGSVLAPDVALALREPIENAGRTVTDDAIDTAVAGTQGYPFLVQLVGYHMWAADPDTETIDKAQAQAGVERAIRRVGRLIHEPALGDLSDIDRSFLAAMSLDDGPSRIADIAGRLGVTVTYAGQYRLRLISTELIAPAGRGRVQFTLPYLRTYLREHAAAMALEVNADQQ